MTRYRDFHRRSIENPEAFWRDEARRIHWETPFDTVLDRSNPPFARWFVGGQINAAQNCVDRHCDGPNKNKAAIVWEGEPGDRRVLTYWDLAREVSRCANALKRLGIQRGDRVDRAEPRAGEHCEERFGDHRQIEQHDVAALHAKRAHHCGHPVDFGI